MQSLAWPGPPRPLALPHPRRVPAGPSRLPPPQTPRRRPLSAVPPPPSLPRRFGLDRLPPPRARRAPASPRCPTPTPRPPPAPASHVLSARGAALRGSPLVPGSPLPALGPRPLTPLSSPRLRCLTPQPARPQPGRGCGRGTVPTPAGRCLLGSLG